MGWEYLVIGLADVNAPTAAKLEERLDEIGKDGWELVAVERVPSQENTRYIFKQPRGRSKAD